MATAIVGLIPTALGPYTHFIVAFLAVPLIMCLGTDAFYYGLLPVVIGVCGNFGVSAEVVAHTLLIAENVGVTISPLTPACSLVLVFWTLSWVNTSNTPFAGFGPSASSLFLPQCWLVSFLYKKLSPSFFAHFS